MPSYPSDPFFESGAMACLIFYRTNGLHGSITCLHNMIRPYLPVVRINAILISKDFTRVIQMFDTKLDSRRTTRISNPERVRLSLKVKKSTSLSSSTIWTATRFKLRSKILIWPMCLF